MPGTSRRRTSRATRRTATVHYAFDALNRLTVTDSLERLRPARVLDGRITTDANNRLVYQLTSAFGRSDGASLQAVMLDGTWALTPDHELALALHRSTRQAADTVYLKGAITGADAHRLVFALHQSERSDSSTTQRVTLSGRWSADADNRLNFLVEKSDGEEDRLTLQGGWEVGAHHELLYRYRQRSTAGRSRDERAVTLDGSWDITSRDRLTYRLAGSSDSAFEFKAGLQSPSLQARAGRLVYQVGVGVSGGRRAARRITLVGGWKLNKDRSVSFEIPYAHGRREAIQFHGIWNLNERNQIAVDLLDRRRQPLGVSVTFSRQFSQDARWFLRLRNEGRETEALAGVQVRF